MRQRHSMNLPPGFAVLLLSSASLPSLIPASRFRRTLGWPEAAHAALLRVGRAAAERVRQRFEHSALLRFWHGVCSDCSREIGECGASVAEPSIGSIPQAIKSQKPISRGFNEVTEAGFCIDAVARRELQAFQVDNSCSVESKSSASCSHDLARRTYGSGSKNRCQMEPLRSGNMDQNLFNFEPHPYVPCVCVCVSVRASDLAT